jgi:hypothetical protein
LLRNEFVAAVSLGSAVRSGCAVIPDKALRDVGP